jgi:uncharacterized membrane protein YfcA
LVSEVVGTVSGFGSSILFVPLASLFFDFKTVLSITAIFHVFSNLSKLLLFNKGNFNKELRQTNRNLYLSGIFSGFIAGIAGSGGAIRGLALAAFQLEKAAFIATSAIIDLGVDLSRSFIYIYNGYFTKTYIYLIPFLIGTSFLGSYIGKLVLNRVSDKVFRYLVIIIVCIASIIQIVKHFN